jgi:hypothetical protein
MDIINYAVFGCIKLSEGEGACGAALKG